MFFVAGCTLLMAAVIWLVWAVKQQSARNGQPVRFTTMESISNDLAQLRTQASFRAEVLTVLVNESTNMAAEHGIRNLAPLTTNLYVLNLRKSDGQSYPVAGLNATTEELDALKRLQKGKVYTFPEVLLK